MKLKTIITSSVDEEGFYFDFLRMRMEDEGLRIQAKSPLFGSYLESISQGPWVLKKNNPWKGGTYHNVGEEFRGVKGFVYPEDPAYFHDGSPNLLWLCHTKLKEGFDLLVTQAISLNNFEDYFAQSCDAVRDFYIANLRKATLEATFSELWRKEVKP